MIQQYIQDPTLLQHLTPQQKVNVYQQIDNYQSQLNQELTKLQTTLTIKRQEQQDLFQQLQQLTNKQTLPQIEEYIQQLQQQFDTQLQQIIQTYNQINQKGADH